MKGENKKMVNSKIFISIGLTKEEFSVLLKSIDFFNYASSTMEYGEHIEECQNIKSKIMRSMKQE